MSRLPDSLVDDVVALCGDERFRHLWRWLEEVRKAWEDEILNSHTNPETREVLVRAREMLQEEVLAIPEIAKSKADKRESRNGSPHTER